MRREKLENLVTTGMLEGKRSRGKQREKLIEGLTDWLKAGKSLEAIEATKDRKKVGGTEGTDTTELRTEGPGWTAVGELGWAAAGGPSNRTTFSTVSIVCPDCSTSGICLVSWPLLSVSLCLQVPPHLRLLQVAVSQPPPPPPLHETGDPWVYLFGPVGTLYI
ncbi:hypothetical protein PoB_002938100 [Plakobranchus ocellatus]|uniref:Uncharacterized protein n=1 Tax=Plakobranchus ocellatus TaxID=259542 RepID=A0AAV3ZV71_9GAST|nr:hypothetical protein PoB_002938100 [Plakobranchus ocellatus]